MEKTFLKRLLVLVLLALWFWPASANSEEMEGDVWNRIVGLPGLRIEAGFQGGLWRPYGLGSYAVNNYSRSSFYTEIGISHPLLFLGEGFDVVDIPSFRLESSSSYQERSESLYQSIPPFLTSGSNLDASGWMTMFKFFSFRWRKEYFETDYFNLNSLYLPNYWGSNNEINAFNIESRELEFGVIGSTDGELHPTMIEIGYFHSTYTRPILIGGDQSWSIYVPELDQEGLYFALNSAPVKGGFPFHSFLSARVGSGKLFYYASPYNTEFRHSNVAMLRVFRLDMRIRHEHQMRQNLKLGLKIEAAFRFVSPSGYNIPESPNDTHYRLSLFVRYDLRVGRQQSSEPDEDVIFTPY